VRSPVDRPEDVAHAGWRPEVEHAAVLLAAATIIAMLVLLVAALLPPEIHRAPARPPSTTVLE
jgi:hypothetical protein